MPFATSKTLDHGTANPVVARLLLQVRDIMPFCNIAKDVDDGILGLCMKPLAPGLLRCWEIRDRYEAEFQRQIETCKNQIPNAQIIQIPWIITLDQDCQNFLYEAKNFLRDLMQLFNLLYGTKFKDASDYLPPKGAKPKPKGAKPSSSVLTFAEQTFGSTDPRTIFFKRLASDVDRIITYRNAVEHPNGHAGPLEIRNFQLKDDKLMEPCWWLPKDVNANPAPIRADLTAIIATLLTLAEYIFVSWAALNLKFPKFNQIQLIPKEQRDPNGPVKYVVDASNELLQLIAEHEKQEAAKAVNRN
jgi:hypothetical protein